MLQRYWFLAQMRSETLKNGIFFYFTLPDTVLQFMLHFKFLGKGFFFLSFLFGGFGFCLFGVFIYFVLGLLVFFGVVKPDKTKIVQQN